MLSILPSAVTYVARTMASGVGGWWLLPCSIYTHSTCEKRAKHIHTHTHVLILVRRAEDGIVYLHDNLYPATSIPTYNARSKHLSRRNGRIESL
jgi:hypothetical protein